MFGKGGGALSAWIKEFCQLVFIQTIQAFIYALCIAVIMVLYKNAVAATAAAQNYNYASGLGLFAIIALLSVFKIEDLVRKMFGFGQTKADHGSAVKSIAKTAFAMQLGKRVLNNGKQIVGGVKNITGSNKDAKKAHSRLERRMQALKQDNGGNTENVATTGSATNPTNPTLAAAQNNDRARYMNAAKKVRALANTQTDPEKKKALLDKAQKYEAKANSLGATLKDNAIAENAGTLASAGLETNGPINTSGSGKNQKSSNYYQNLLNIQEQYEDAIDAAKKKRKEGYRMIAKGAAESVGATIGATAGGILGVADGNIDEGINGMMAGAGLGDAAGELATNAVFGTSDFLSSARKTTTKAVKDYTSSIKQQYETERKNVANQLKDLNNDAQKAVNRVDKSAAEARASLEKDVELSAGQTAKAMARAVKKGSAKAYNSRHGGIKQLETDLKNLESHIKATTTTQNIGNNVESID